MNIYIYKVGVVGAGLMGSGIAQVISYAGIPVVLKDVSDDLVAKGIAAARAVYAARVKKGKMSEEDVQLKMQLIRGTTRSEDFSDVDLVIEAVSENLELKKSIFRELHTICPPHALFATNTSALSISALAAASGRPEQVVGLHFFYPASVMKLVEVIPALQTSQETVDTLISFAEALRKIPVRVKECAGFLVNRLLRPYLCEAVFLLEEGSASAEEIDRALIEFGMPMGPFTLADQLGIDICYHVATVLNHAYGERALVPTLLERLYQQKCWGVKSGAGFYTYDGGANCLQNILANMPCAKVVEKVGSAVERLLFPMVNEAALCLDEGVASPNDIEIAMMAGTGFPQKTGGLLHYADSVGLDRVLGCLREWTQKGGPRFHPAPLLQRMVDAGFVGTKAKRGFFAYS